MESPRPEEACRDRLVEIVQPLLLPRGVTVEPERHMAADKHADISIAMPASKILCELKCDYHRRYGRLSSSNWNGFFASDPEPMGLGIFVVFWFGENMPDPIPVPPGG